MLDIEPVVAFDLDVRGDGQTLLCPPLRHIDAQNLERSVAQHRDKLLEVFLEHLQLELARIAHTSILLFQNLLHLLVNAR